MKVVLLTLIGHLVPWKLHGAKSHAALDPGTGQTPQFPLAIEATDAAVKPLSLLPDVLQLLELATEDDGAAMVQRSRAE
jgi:hypothetical protein